MWKYGCAKNPLCFSCHGKPDKYDRTHTQSNYQDCILYHRDALDSASNHGEEPTLRKLIRYIQQIQSVGQLSIIMSLKPAGSQLILIICRLLIKNKIVQNIPAVTKHRISVTRN